MPPACTALPFLDHTPPKRTSSDVVLIVRWCIPIPGHPLRIGVPPFRIVPVAHPPLGVDAATAASQSIRPGCAHRVHANRHLHALAPIERHSSMTRLPRTVRRTIMVLGWSTELRTVTNRRVNCGYRGRSESNA